MADARAVGIDLGTSNSAVAWVDASGQTTMLRNAEGDIITPSVVLFDDSEVIVGKEARRLAHLYSDRVAEWVKRDMGQPVYSRPIRGERLPPEVIQACILRKLKADILATVGPTAKAVITVPAYFDELRRKATADAGEMAGLSLLDIVNEPTAAALGFGEALGYLSPLGKPLGEMVVMVYDLGGGTFDATLLRLAPGDIRTLATDGDVQLGGHDWDTRLVNYAAEAFRQAHGRDPRDDPGALSRLYATAVEAKHTLSARTRATLRVEYAGLTCEVPVTREAFEEMTADLVERTAYTIRQLLAAAGLQWSDVARLLLVGGATRMPMVSRRLHELTGLTPDRTVNPDEAVARGAAIYAKYLLAVREGGPAGATFKVTNVNSHSLGVEGIDPQTYRKVNIVLIPRNTPLPAKAVERFMTKTEGQRSIVIQVLEGESSLPGECMAIGRTVIRDLPAGLPKGWPVEVSFEYGENGRLTVRGQVPGTHREVVLDLERDVGLSNEGISRWKQAVASTAGFDAFENMIQEVLNVPVAAKAVATPNSAWSSSLAAPSAPRREVPPIQSQPMPLDAPVVSGPTPARVESPLPLGAPLGSGPEFPSHGGAGRTAGLDDGAPTFVPLADAPPAGSNPLRWVGSLIGYGLSAAVGIAAGYLLISWLFPGRVPRFW